MSSEQHKQVKRHVTELGIYGGPKQVATQFCQKHRNELIKPSDVRCALGRKRGVNCRPAKRIAHEQ